MIRLESRRSLEYIYNQVDTADYNKMAILEIPRFCNQCGKKFIYRIPEQEFRQFKGDITYICQDCDDLSPSIDFHIVGDYKRLDEIWATSPLRGLRHD